MRYFLLTLLAMLCLCQTVWGQQQPDSIRVTFRIHAATLLDSQRVYLSGSTPELGNWQPDKVALEYVGGQVWEKILYLKEPSVAYKFTLGSWETEATDANGEPLPNFSLQLEGDTLVQHELRYWLKKEERKVTGGITGTVRYHRNLTADSLKPRDLIVWLPPGYEKGSKRYPVLYLHDGQNVFDPATSSFGVDWRIDEIADSMIRSKRMEPVIIVGINNTPDRMEEYVPGTKGSAYMDFVVNTVKPLLDQSYRTKPSAKHTLTGGSSAGGIIAFMLAWEYPQVFSKAICMSPAFKIMHINYVKDVQAYTGKKRKLKFYIDNGGVDLEARLQPGIDEMLTALQEKGYREGKDYVWILDTNAQHNEAAWSKRMPRALTFMLGK
ncbi:alpha/beta hydrolase-fold protein [Pontibacter sp. HSC-36F09]|uniref:alpha/beta hydrolase-fold protein n=1 Tax=Pontibacter sp. HSC-36F09 TaxID=2910966 RepID=UPI0020A231E6|nr:alpha/beta hydrolase-fold protein [Pontibacter sp. HSC-36F09]MCP2044341.1 enterochelin esterase-like enzyme [Pontibacter sp. HSC-36F09]